MEKKFIGFLKNILRTRGYSMNRLAHELGVNHSTVSRWLAGKNVPDARSCQLLATFCSIPAEEVLSVAGYLPERSASGRCEWPEFREYAHHKYPGELDEDVIVMIEDLIASHRRKKHGKKSA
jgi:transcriptional regulator with XRE-family HTH domain